MRRSRLGVLLGHLGLTAFGIGEVCASLAEVSDDLSSSIGGASGDAGVEYRRAVAAYAVVHGLTGTPLRGFGVGVSAQVTAVSLETDDPVDDIRVDFANGAAAYVQAKRTLRKGKALKSAVAQWVQAADSGRVVPGRDHLVIVTGSLSGPLRVLQRVLRRLKTDHPSSLTKEEQTELGHLRKLLGTLDDNAQAVVLKCASIHVLEVEEPDEAAAREGALLLGKFVEPAGLPNAWSTLVGLAGVTARLRGGFDMSGWLARLRDEGVVIQTSGGTPAAELQSQHRAVERYVASCERKAAFIDLRTLGAQVAPIRFDDIDADVEVLNDDGRGTTLLLWSFLRRGRVILTGLPGAGKSTALVRLAAVLPQIDDWLPIRASLRDVDALDHSRTFQDRLLEVALRDVTASDRPLLTRELSGRIESGQAVLLLDGLDETYYRRAAVVAEVDVFLASCPVHLSVLLSTRDVAYGHAATLGWPEIRLAAPDGVDNLVDSVLAACHSAVEQRGETVDSADWLRTRRVWVHSALSANSTLRETPLVPILLALLAGERDVERLPTARCYVMKAVVDSLLVRRDADPDRLRIGALTGEAAVAATGDVFATEARALVDGGGTRELSELRIVVADELADRWHLATGQAEVTAEAAIRFWDEHGIFVISGAKETVTPRLPLFSEIGDAMSAVRNEDELDVWLAERASQGAVESLVLAAGLASLAAEKLVGVASSLSDRSLLHGAVRAHLEGAEFQSESLDRLRSALLADVEIGGREGWVSLRRLLQLPTGESEESLMVALDGYPESHQAIGRAAIAIHYRSREELRSEPTLLLDALGVSQLESLQSREVADRPNWRDLAVDHLYGRTIEDAAEVLVGAVEEATDLVVARLRTVGMRTSSKLQEILDAVGLGDRSLEASVEPFRKTAQLMANLDYDADDYLRFCEQISDLAPAAHIELPERTKLDHLASFVETMWLNDVGSWGRSFRTRMNEVADLVATLGSFDRPVIAAEACMVLNRIGTFGGHEPFFSLFQLATRRELSNWAAVSDREQAVDLLIQMMSWGLGSARLAASALWSAPVADLAVPQLRALVPRLVPYVNHQRIAALTLCSLVEGPEPESWLRDDDPILRAVCADWLEPVGTDGAITEGLQSLLFDTDRNVLAAAVRRLAGVEPTGRVEELRRIADSPEPGWTCLSCRTINPAGATSCGAEGCLRVPSSPSKDARKILDGTLQADN